MCLTELTIATISWGQPSYSRFRFVPVVETSSHITKACLLEFAPLVRSTISKGSLLLASLGLALLEVTAEELVLANGVTA